MPDARYKRVWEYLADLPGVVGPDDSGPAREYVDPEEADSTTPAEESADA